MIKKISKIFLFSFVIPFSLFYAYFVFAQAPETVNLVNPLGEQNPDLPFLLGWAGTVIKGFIGVTGGIALVMFVYGGFLWLTSRGEIDKIKKGRDIFIWSIVGLAIIFSSYLLVDFIIQNFQSAKIQACFDEAKKQAAECYLKNPDAEKNGDKKDECLQNLIKAREQCKASKGKEK